MTDLLPIPRRPRPRLVRFLLHIGAVLRCAVPALAFEMIDGTPRVEPDHDIAGTMLLGFLLGGEEGWRFNNRGRATDKNGSKTASNGMNAARTMTRYPPAFHGLTLTCSGVSRAPHLVSEIRLGPPLPARMGPRSR